MVSTVTSVMSVRGALRGLSEFQSIKLALQGRLSGIPGSASGSCCLNPQNQLSSGACAVMDIQASTRMCS